MSDVYAFIEAEKTTHPVALMCRLLKVARSSFYAWLAGEQARAARRAGGQRGPRAVGLNGRRAAERSRESGRQHHGEHRRPAC
ncbi:hypothetical protein ACWGPD_30480 [Streptomyces hirsutus]|uniref:hypothetical protein n=1 Tax=Streptomyces hirsutus TaxID=35620 RepID=UPI003329B9BF